MSGKTTYYENENGVHYAQFDSDCELPMLSQREFSATVRRLENGSLQVKPKTTGQRVRSRAVTLMRTRHICLSLGVDRRLHMTMLVPESDIEKVCLYLMEEVPQVMDFIYGFLAKMRK